MRPHSHKKRATASISPKIRAAMGVLIDAFRYAEETSGNHWEFAVEIQLLTALGLSANDLRWLVRQGWVEHQREVTSNGQNGRAYRATGDMTFARRTCFIMTDDGAAFARRIFPHETTRALPHLGVENRRRRSKLSSSATDKRRKTATRSGLPKWDPERRTLTCDGMLVKRFKCRAVNQEAILAAFQEEGWTCRIDDPLSPGLEQDVKRRLSDTIKCLNRKQHNPMLRFHGDGTGEGITWERVGQ